MKKLFALVLTALFTIRMITGCSRKTEEPAQDNMTVYKVGICNFVDDASLNQIVKNIQNQLKVIGDENDVKFDINLQNCNTDSSLLQQIISEFIEEDVDLMVGIATPVAMAMQSAVEGKNIPVVFAAVSDPLGVGLVDSLEAPGSFITGTSDYLDTNAIFRLVTTVNPDISKVGLLYDVGQDSSTAAINDAKAFLQANNIECVVANGNKMEEIKIAAQQLIDAGVEAVFTPSDNSIMAAELGIYKMFADAKIPHYAGADSFALNGAFLGYGVDYANLGVETANIAKAILLDGKDTASLSVMTFDNGIATVNTETAEALGLKYEDLEKVFAPMCTNVLPIQTAEEFE